jgi:hypothetical protein
VIPISESESTISERQAKKAETEEDSSIHAFLSQIPSASVRLPREPSPPPPENIETNDIDNEAVFGPASDEDIAEAESPWTETERIFQQNLQSNSSLIRDCLAIHNGFRSTEGDCNFFVADGDTGSYVKCTARIAVYCHDCEGINTLSLIRTS